MSLMEKTIEIPMEHEKNIFGGFDVYIKMIEHAFHTTMIARNGEIKIVGDSTAVEKTKQVLGELLALSAKGNVITDQNVNYAIALAMENNSGVLTKLDEDLICHTIQGKPIKPKTLGQKKYVDAIRKKMIVFGI